MKKSISYWSFSGKNVFEAMRLAKDAGFDGIELTLDAEGDVTMETAPEKLAEIRRAAGGNRHCAAECGKQPVLGVFVYFGRSGGAGKGASGGSLRDQNGKGAGRGHSFDRARAAFRWNLCRSGRLWRMMCAGSARWPR